MKSRVHWLNWCAVLALAVMLTAVPPWSTIAMVVAVLVTAADLLLWLRRRT